MKIIIVSFILGISTYANSAALLVSVEEMKASNTAQPLLIPKSTPHKDAPVIELSAPKLSTYVTSPTPIELRFQPSPPSTVRLDTLKVLYGALEIDITKRILNVAKVTEAGVSVLNATLPIGKHKMSVVIEDTAGRKGKKIIEFEVK
jgi:hypothetical protein